MKKFFAMDGKLLSVLNTIADLAILNILWLICCIPVVTIGASTSAMYSVTLKMVRREEPYIVRGFFDAFRENFKQSTIVWIGMMAAGCLLYFDLYALGHAGTAGMRLVSIPVFIGMFLVIAVGCYIFSMIAYFKTGTAEAVKNAIRLAIGYLPYTIAIFVLQILPVILLFGQNLIVSLFIDVVIGVAASRFAASYLLLKVFHKVHVVEKNEELEAGME